MQDQIRLKLPSGEDIELLYILGSSYSGSTLLTFLLAEHPEISTIGELKATQMGDLSTYYCSCGELIETCGFWNRVHAEMKARGEEWSLNSFGTHFNCGPGSFRHLIRLGVRNAWLGRIGDILINIWPRQRTRLMKIISRNMELIESICLIQGGCTFLDGSKDPDRLRVFRRNFNNRIKVIWLNRDARGIANSFRKHEQMSVRQAARQWIGTQKACHSVLADFADADVMMLRYEDLCQNQEKVIREIFSFIGVDSSARIDARQAQPSLHILGNSMRLTRNRPIVLDEKWKRELPPQKLIEFEALAGVLNRNLGYMDSGKMDGPEDGQ